MHKSASRNISIFLTGIILLAWFTLLPSSLSAAGLHELSDGEMAQVYGTGFSSFTLDGTGLATLDFKGITISTYTTIGEMAMGYYNKTGYGLGWDNDWKTVSLGNSNNDPLVATGLFIKAQFSDIDSPTGRQLEWLQIGADHLKGDISAANFQSFSGTINGTTYNRANLTSSSLSTITSNGTSGFNLTLDKNNGFSFNFGSGSSIH